MLWKVDRARPAPSQPKLRVLALGRRRAALEQIGGTVELSPRHSEILTLLALHPEGLSGEQLAVEIYGANVKAVTIRAEMSRLRRLLGCLVHRPPVPAARGHRCGLPRRRAAGAGGRSGRGDRPLRRAPAPRVEGPGDRRGPRAARARPTRRSGGHRLAIVRRRAGDRVDALHRLRELDRLVVHHRARVERRVGHDAVHAAALHAEVARVVERQHGGLAQVAVELVLAVDGVTPTTCMHL